MVTSVLASYRAFDTLGETAVVFAAAIGVFSLLGLPKQERAAIKSGLQSHLVLRVVAKLIIPLIILFALICSIPWRLWTQGADFKLGL